MENLGGGINAHQVRIAGERLSRPAIPETGSERNDRQYSEKNKKNEMRLKWFHFSCEWRKTAIMGKIPFPALP